jgi:hypothetical protein
MAQVWKDINEVWEEKRIDKPTRKVRAYAVLNKWYLDSNIPHEQLAKTYTNQGKQELELKCRELNQRDKNKMWYYAVVVEREVVDTITGKVVTSSEQDDD